MTNLSALTAEEQERMAQQAERWHAHYDAAVANWKEALTRMEQAELKCERLAQQQARLTEERDFQQKRADDRVIAYEHKALQLEQAEARAARLRAALERACTLFEEHRAAHADPTDVEYNGCDTEPCACCEESLAIAAALAEDKP